MKDYYKIAEIITKMFDITTWLTSPYHYIIIPFPINDFKNVPCIIENIIDRYPELFIYKINYDSTTNTTNSEQILVELR